MPTDAGQEGLERARQLRLDAGDLIDTAQRRSDPLTGTVRTSIGTVAPATVPGRRARQIAVAIRSAYPAATPPNLTS